MRRVLILGVLLIAMFAPSATSQVFRDYRSVTLHHTLNGNTFVTTDSLTVRILGIDVVAGDDIGLRLLDSLLGTGPLRLTFDLLRSDEAGRTLASVETVDQVDVGATMISRGCALAYARFPYAFIDRYFEIELDARQALRGIWQGHFCVVK